MAPMVSLDSLLQEITKAQTFDELRAVVIHSILPQLEHQRSTLRAMIDRHEMEESVGYKDHVIKLDCEIAKLHLDLFAIEGREVSNDA